LLCDEPSGNLDANNSAALHDMLATLSREHGVAVLVVTHDAGLARRAARPLTLRGGKPGPAWTRPAPPPPPSRHACTSASHPPGSRRAGRYGAPDTTPVLRV